MSEELNKEQEIANKKEYQAKYYKEHKDELKKKHLARLAKKEKELKEEKENKTILEKDKNKSLEIQKKQLQEDILGLNNKIQDKNTKFPNIKMSDKEASSFYQNLSIDYLKLLNNYKDMYVAEKEKYEDLLKKYYELKNNFDNLKQINMKNINSMQAKEEKIFKQETIINNLNSRNLFERITNKKIEM